MRLDFEDTELDRLADALAPKVAERLRPLLQAKTAGRDSGTIYTVETLSERLHVPKSKIYNLVHHKEISYFKVGRSLRFREADIDRLILKTYTPALNNSPSHNGRGVATCQG